MPPRLEPIAARIAPVTSTVEVTGARDEEVASRVEVNAADLELTSTVEGARPLLSAPAEVKSRPRTRVELAPTSATAYSLKARVSADFAAEFEQVQAALSHKFPDGDFEDVLRECFRITLETIERKRLGRNRGPAADAPARADARATGDASQEPGSRGEKNSRHIAKAVRRAVWARDEGRCAFVSADGKRCGSTHLLQFHHVDPFACGGPPTVENLSLRCWTHNKYDALLDLGPELVARHVPGAEPIDRSKLLPRWKCGTPSLMPRGRH